MGYKYKKQETFISFFKRSCSDSPSSYINLLCISLVPFSMRFDNYYFEDCARKWLFSFPIA